VAFLVYDNTALSFTLPLGAGGHYSPLTFNVQKNIPNQTYYDISVKSGAPATATLPATLDRVSDVRYLNITTDQPTSIAAASLQIIYDTADHITDKGRLCMAQNVSGIWVDLSSIASGNAANGNITNAVNITSVGDFVLADATNTLKLGINRGVSTANLNVSDVYMVTTTGDGRVKLKVSTTENAAVNAQLLDGDSATVLNSLYLTGNNTGSFEQDGLAMGSYYVKLSPATAGQIYGYQLTDSLFVPAQPEGKEPDSTTALANAIAASRSSEGHIGYYYKNHRDSSDWYRL